jgi:phospholipid transport system substrate-binding protein
MKSIWRARTVSSLSLALVLILAQFALGGTLDRARPVREFYQVLLNAMGNGPALGQAGRFAKLAPVVRQAFDIPFMTRLAIGPAWAMLSGPQRQRVTQAFERYVTAVYAERFDRYSGERLEVLGEQPTNYGVMVRMQIVKSNGEPISINYLVVNNSGRWQIGDVYLNGTISELATRRSEFTSILRTRGVDGLIAALNDKALTLAPPRS